MSAPEYFKVEIATCAQSKGNLTWDSWSHDAITALGLSGVRNPLGFAIVRFLSEPQPHSADVWRIILVLSGDLIAKGMETSLANKVAGKAMEYWADMKCPHCAGRGVTDFEQTQCEVCAGTGEKQLPCTSDAVKDAISMLISAENWMEKQLCARLKKGY